MKPVAALGVFGMLWPGALCVAQTPGAAESIRIETAARSIQPGELVLFTARPTTPVETLRVRAFDRNLPAFRVDGHAWQVLVGIDLSTPAGTHPVAFAGESGDQTVRTTTTLTVSPRTFETRRITVDDSFVNPTGAVLERILKEAADLRDLWEQSTPNRLWDGAFVRPVPARANSRFGTRSIINGEPRQPHSGVDFLSPAGTTVKAPNSGRVVLARELHFTGHTVVIDHGLGMFSLFAHLSSIDVDVGDTITTGHIVGEVGATGRVTGAHLHWTVRLHGARVDPMAVLAVLNGKTD